MRAKGAQSGNSRGRVRFLVPIAVSVLLFVATPKHTSAQESVSINECIEIATCDKNGNCQNAKTRVLIAELHRLTEKPRHFVMGPLVPEAGGGLFHENNIQMVDGEIPTPSNDVGRAFKMTMGNDLKVTLLVYRPGKEVAGFRNVDWVRADYACEQVLF